MENERIFLTSFLSYAAQATILSIDKIELNVMFVLNATIAVITIYKLIKPKKKNDNR